MDAMILSITVTIIFVTFLVFVYFIASSPPSYQLGDFSSNDPSKNPNAFPEDFTYPISYRCLTDSDCDNDLVCDMGNYLCKKPEKGKCRTSNDCITGTFCNTTCIDDSVPVGISDEVDDPLFYLTPCPNGYVSSIKAGTASISSDNQGNLICRKAPCTPCTKNIECDSQLCQYKSVKSLLDCDGVTGKNCFCQPGKGLGVVCDNDNQCGSKNCVPVGENKTCQKPGDTSISLGLACSEGSGEGFCPSGQRCINGTCGNVISGILEGCNNRTNFCPNFTNCYQIPSIKYPDQNDPDDTPPEYNDKFAPCTDKSDICTCQFYTFPNNNDGREGLINPNIIDTGIDFVQQCIPGMTRDQNNDGSLVRCLTNDGGPSNSDISKCSSNNTTEKGTFLYILNVPFKVEDNRNGTYPTNGLIGVKNFFYTPVNIENGVFSYNNITKIHGLSFGYPIDFLNGVGVYEDRPPGALEVIAFLDNVGKLYLAKYNPNVDLPAETGKALNLDFCAVNFTSDPISDISSINRSSGDLSVPTLYALSNGLTDNTIWKLEINTNDICNVTATSVITVSDGFTYNKLSSYNYVKPRVKLNNILVKDYGIYHMISTEDNRAKLYNQDLPGEEKRTYMGNKNLSRGELNETISSTGDGEDVKTIYSLGYMTINNGEFQSYNFASDFKDNLIKNFTFPNYINESLFSTTYQFSIVSNDVTNYGSKNFSMLTTTSSSKAGIGEANIYHISNSAQVAIPGYFSTSLVEKYPPDTFKGGNTVFSITPTQFYIMVGRRCGNVN
jgi:hypothetical protein